MVKGISRRVVVVESPDPRIFEQAIFIVRNDALTGSGITSQEIVDEARRVAKSYTQGAAGQLTHRWHSLPPALYTVMGAGGCGLVWLLVSLL